MSQLVPPPSWGVSRANRLRLAGYPALPVHVIIGTSERRPVFSDSRVAEPVFRYLASHPASLAVVLMPDHLHWLIEDGSDLPRLLRRVKSFTTREARLSSGMKRIWQRSYFDAVVRDEKMCRRVAWYIVANPVRAGLCESLGEYPWVHLASSMGTL